MNMFRHLLTLVLLALAVGLFLSDPTTWRWADPAGAWAVTVLVFLGEFKPFSYLLLFAIAGALFMTRRQL
jgi:divalent metal cation (Fe/Co/Zn/Cd) transporter